MGHESKVLEQDWNGFKDACSGANFGFMAKRFSVILLILALK
jgi:hypothetical protein